MSNLLEKATKQLETKVTITYENMLLSQAILQVLLATNSLDNPLVREGRQHLSSLQQQFKVYSYLYWLLLSGKLTNQPNQEIINQLDAVIDTIRETPDEPQTNVVLQTILELMVTIAREQ